jgi:hypothetical protein
MVVETSRLRDGKRKPLTLFYSVIRPFVRRSLSCLCVTSESALASAGINAEDVGPTARSLENEAFTSATTEAGDRSSNVVVDFYFYSVPFAAISIVEV